MDVEADLLIALRRIAGVASGDDFRVHDGDVSFDVDYVGGSSSRLTLQADYDAVARAEVPGTHDASYRASARGGVLTGIRPMSIVLKREYQGDRAAKAEGVNAEYQTGDRAFDDAVYVDTPTTRADVLGAVLNEGVRAAVLALLALEFHEVVLDDRFGQVTAQIAGFAHLTAPAEAASRIVSAFASLLRGLPPVRDGGGQHPRRSAWPAIAAVTGWAALFVGCPTGLSTMADAHPASGAGAPVATALVFATVAGIFAGRVARAIAKPRMSGRSDSSGRLTLVSLAAFAWVTLATALATALLVYRLLER